MKARRFRLSTVRAQGCVTGCFGLVVLIAVLLGFYWGGRALGWLGAGEGEAALNAEAPDAEASNARAILGRAWFDRLPEDPRSTYHFWVWLAGGIGIHDHGSAYDSRLEIFEFERRGAEVEMVFLQSKKPHKTSFQVRECDELPPFTLCLDLERASSGPKRLYGFGGVDDFAAHVPWGPARLRAAEELARGSGRP